MNKKQVNEAILKVMLTQYKKDAKEYHEIVEKAGYTITKYNGLYHVKNKETGKELWAKKDYVWWSKYSSRQWTIIIELNGLRVKKYKSGQSIPLDFVSYLDKPMNKEWYEMVNKGYWGQFTKGYWQRDRLKSAKRSLEIRKKEIKTVKESIANMENSLEDKIRNMIRVEYEIEALRKEFGLIK